MTVEKPEARRDIQFGDDVTLAEFTAVQADLGDAVYHQHGRRRQLGIARTEIAAFARFEQIFLRVGRLRSVEVARVGQDNSFGVWLAVAQRQATLSRPFFLMPAPAVRRRAPAMKAQISSVSFSGSGRCSLIRHSDQRLANSADHQRNGEMWIDVMGNKAVTLRRLEHERAAGELFVCESLLDIQDFGRAAQSADDEGSEGVVVVEGDIAGYSPSLSVRPAFRGPAYVVKNLFIEAL